MNHDRHRYHDPEDESTCTNRAEIEEERGDRLYDEMIENRLIEKLEARDAARIGLTGREQGTLK